MSNNAIWVVADQHAGAIEGATYELLGKARELGGPLAVILIGSGVKTLAAGLGDYGVDTVYVADHADLADYRAETYGAVVAKLVTEHAPALVLFSATSSGRDVASFVSATTKIGIAPDANSISGEPGAYKITRPIFGGNALANLATSGATALVTVLPKAFEKATAGAGKTANVVDVTVDSAALAAKTQVMAFAAEVAAGKINLNDAEIVVAGGRGVGGAEKFGIIEDLARALGAAVGASRAVTDAGWRPVNEQIGQTGVTIKPKLYIAAGISGAVQHWVGMKEAGYIIAINKDADAPIMKVADLALVGDLFTIVPELIKAVNAAKGVAV